MTKKIFSVGLAFSLSIAACSDDERPLSAEEATDSVNTMLDAHGAGLKNALAVTNEGLLQSLFQVLNGGYCDGSTITNTPRLAESAWGAMDVEEEAFDLQYAEQASSSQVRYTVGPEIHCRAYTNPSPSYNDCASELEQNPVVWLVRSPEEGKLHVELLLGANEHRVLKIDLDENNISGEIDLAVLAKAEQEFIHVIDSDPPLALEAKGKIGFSVARIEDGVYTINVNVLSDIEVIAPGRNVPDTEFRLAKAVPALVLEMSQPDKIFRTTASFADFELIVPENDYCDPTTKDCASLKTINVNMSGLSGVLEIDGIDEQIRFTDVSIGNQSATAVYGENPVVDVAWNTDSEGKFSGSLEMVDEGLKLTLEPKLDLAAAISLSEVAGSDAPDWLQDQLFEVMIGGPPKAELLMPKQNGCIEFNGIPEIKVLAGMIDATETNNTSSELYSLSVASDMCMVGAENPGSDFLFSYYEEGSCN
ncbi:MAG: hypothetical protein IPJ88_03140 [Myxococcales bacterium]|nr:MAG: hypothetical protein IPJ88_03140 [Myxococcales bacterium]